MPDKPLAVMLACPACRWQSECGIDDLVERLRAVGMFRRNRDPAPEEVLELLRASASRLACDACERQGLLVLRGDEADGGWPEARRCTDCGRPISAERLEALPEAVLCIDCQQSDERGAAASEGDYCPRCGSAMVIRPTRSAGITRNELVCSDYPRCRGRGQSIEY